MKNDYFFGGRGVAWKGVYVLREMILQKCGELVLQNRRY